MRLTHWLIMLILGLIFISGGIMAASSDTIILVAPVGVSSLEPGRTGDSFSFQAIVCIFETLVTTSSSKPVSFVPCLAERWEMLEQGKKWLFHLRQGVFFHNGEPFNAYAVESAFNRCLNYKGPEYENWKVLFPYLVRVQAVDADTVAFYLSKPYLPFLAALSHPATSIPAPGSYRTATFNPIGTGPFKFNRHETNGDFLMESYNHYWNGPVRVAKLIFKTIPNTFSRMMEVKTGGADVVKIRSLSERDSFLGKTEFKSLVEPGLSISYLAFNTRKAPFNKPDIRRVFAYLINKIMLVKLSYQDLAIPARSPLPPQLPGFNKSIKEYSFDVQQARALLKKAGLEKGFSCTLYYAENNPALQKIADIIATNAKSINITIQKNQKSFNDMFQACKNGVHDLALLTWTGGPDPYLFLSPVLAIQDGSYNMAFYNNPIFNGLLEEYRSSLSVTAGKNFIEKSQVVFSEDSPWIPLFHLNNTAIFNQSVHNLSFDANGMIIFKNAYKTPR